MKHTCKLFGAPSSNGKKRHTDIQIYRHCEWKEAILELLDVVVILIQGVTYRNNLSYSQWLKKLKKIIFLGDILLANIDHKLFLYVGGLLSAPLYQIGGGSCSPGMETTESSIWSKHNDRSIEWQYRLGSSMSLKPIIKLKALEPEPSSKFTACLKVNT